MVAIYETPVSIAQDRDEFIDRLLGETIGAFNVFAVHIGCQLGFYRALAGGEWLTANELAVRTGTHERYTREWLEQQASSCVLQSRNDDSSEGKVHFRLAPGRAEVLTDRDSLNYLAPLAQLLVGSVQPIEALLKAYKKGGGVPFSEYGVHLREGQASMNRPAFLYQLGTEWLPSIPDIHVRLQALPPARIADIGCGAGWSSIGMAQAYPHAMVDGYDLDLASVELARTNIQNAGLTDRVNIYHKDAGDPSLESRYDLVTAFECVHDLSDPVSVLRTMRELAGEEGAVIIMDERTAESFQSCAEVVEQLLYGFSILHCLPAGMSDQPSAATGTVMRTETLKRYASEAGFARVEILPIDNFFFRFYRLYG